MRSVDNNDPETKAQRDWPTDQVTLELPDIEWPFTPPPHSTTQLV